MSNKSIEQALAHLIPTHADALPPEIVSLASSLYAQSWVHGSALKPEEEIARPHACAEIACKRLSRTLRLPPLIGRPPCPPRMYGRIYKYIEAALAKASVIRKSGSSRRKTTAAGASGRTGSGQAAVGNGSGGGTSARASTSTPTTTTRMGSSEGPPSTPVMKKRTRGTLAEGAAVETVTTDTDLADASTHYPSVIDAPSWTMPLIRNVCRVQLGDRADSRDQILAREQRSRTAFMAPHISTGLSHIALYIHEEAAQGWLGGGSSGTAKDGMSEQDVLDQQANQDFMRPIVKWYGRASRRQRLERLNGRAAMTGGTAPPSGLQAPPDASDSASTGAGAAAATETSREAAATTASSALVTDSPAPPTLSAVPPPDPNNPDDDIAIPDFRGRVVTLIVALYLVLYSRFLSKQADRPAGSTEAYEEMSRCALAVINFYGSEYLDDVDRWLTIMLSRGWTDGKEWFDGISFEDSSAPESVGEGDSAERKRRKTHADGRPLTASSTSSSTAERARTDSQNHGGLQPGLATMMQDRLDFLSAEKRERYAEWKSGVMERIKQIEAEDAASTQLQN